MRLLILPVGITSDDFIIIATGNEVEVSIDAAIENTTASFENNQRDLLVHSTELKNVKNVAALPPAYIERITCGRTKTTSIILNRFGPSQQQRIANDLKRCRFSILLDESTDISSRKSLAIVVRYFAKRLEV